jgi:cysteine desulfurase NifS/selenium donor protein
MKAIYLDYNATTPIDPAVAGAMEPFLREHFGNPSSSHVFGAAARTAVENARRQVAGLIGAKPYEVIFTSGGTESNNLAIQGIAFGNKNRGRHIITSSVEHPAVMEVCRYLETKGFRITRLPVDKYGMVAPDSVRDAIMPDTILISVMHANNEVGTIQPVKEIAEIAREFGIIIHSDAAQSAGKINTDVNELGVDLLSIAGHKIYAPKGVGALYIREGVNLEKFIHGADHEHNIRPGTENVLEIVGLGKASEIAARDLERNSLHMKAVRDRLREGLMSKMPFMQVNGHPGSCLPNTLSVSFAGMEAATVLASMDGLAASAGAACHADQVDVSPVLKAMGIPEDVAMGTIRLSTGKYTTNEEIDRAVEDLTDTVLSMRPAENDTNSKPEYGNIRLTHFTHGLGCACKLRPQDLETVLRKMPVSRHPDVIVGAESSDDAAVYRINDEMAVVQTVDFFTPVVDDPYQFGSITAANALSDIYAMGAEPLFALNIVAFPSKRLPMEVLHQILRGAADKAAEAGMLILGGHTIEDNEPKFGMAVTGRVHPDQVWKNNTSINGHLIALTKPIGTGILSTALKRGLLTEQEAGDLYTTMSRLNKKASEIMKAFPVSAVTDVTGFGLLGHLGEITKGSRLDAEIWVKKVPFMGKAREMLAANIIPGGTLNNLEYVSNIVIPDKGVTKPEQLLLADAQTSGGLLFTIPESEAESLEKDFRESGQEIYFIGRMINDGKGLIYLKD